MSGQTTACKKKKKRENDPTPMTESELLTEWRRRLVNMNLFFKYYKEKATRKRRRGIATSSGYICFLSWNEGGVGGLKNVTHRNLNDTRKKGRQPTGRGVNNFVCFSNAPELSNKSLLFTLQLFPTPSIFFYFRHQKNFVLLLCLSLYTITDLKIKNLSRWMMIGGF